MLNLRGYPATPGAVTGGDGGNATATGGNGGNGGDGIEEEIPPGLGGSGGAATATEGRGGSASIPELDGDATAAPGQNGQDGTYKH